MRLKDKVVILTGSGQSPGDTIGNGRASAILYARDGAKVFIVDKRLAAAEETPAMIDTEGGVAPCFEADITCGADCKALAASCMGAFGRIDVLHNNVGIMVGDEESIDLEEVV